MGDLTPGQSSQPVRLEGANSSGTPTGWVASDGAGGMLVVGEGTAGSPVGGVLSIQGVSGGTNVPVSQGAPNTVTNAWPTKLTDGTNTAAVKAASTAPAATDPAVVAVLSPNGNQATAASQATQITQLSSIFTAQSNGTQKTQLVDASGNIITSTTTNSKQRLDVELSSEAVDGSTSPFSTVQVGGKDSSGNLQTLATQTDGQLKTSDIADGSGVTGIISVTSTAVAVRVGGSNLALRKRLTFTNIGTLTVYWAYTNAVTGAGNGIPMFRNQFASDSWGPNTTIWVVCPTGTSSVAVAEGA